MKFPLGLGQVHRIGFNPENYGGVDAPLLAPPTDSLDECTGTTARIKQAIVRLGRATIKKLGHHAINDC